MMISADGTADASGTGACSRLVVRLIRRGDAGGLASAIKRGHSRLHRGDVVVVMGQATASNGPLPNRNGCGATDRTVALRSGESAVVSSRGRQIVLEPLKKRFIFDPAAERTL